METLGKKLANWTDIDIACHELAVILGMIEYDEDGQQVRAKKDFFIEPAR